MIYSAGYAGQPSDQLLRALYDEGVRVLADVRSAPGSRAFPEYNKQQLSSACQRAGIEYVCMGPALGPRSHDPAHYRGDQVDFGLLSQSAAFRQGLESLIELSKNRPVACLCAEKHPETCHRSLLIGEALHREGVQMIHRHQDGRLESHADMRVRLAADQGGLFPDEDLAMEQQCARFAYKKPSAPTPSFDR